MYSIMRVITILLALVISISGFGNVSAAVIAPQTDDQIASFLASNPPTLNVDYDIQIGRASLLDVSQLPEYPILPTADGYVTYVISYTSGLGDSIGELPANGYVAFFDSDSKAQAAFKTLPKNAPKDALVQTDEIAYDDELTISVYAETFTNHPLPVDFTKLHKTAYLLINNVIAVIAIEWSWIDMPNQTVMKQSNKVETAVLGTNIAMVVTILRN